MSIFDNMDQCYIDLNKIVQDRSMLSVTRLLASTLLNIPYMSLGDFVKSLSNDDLNILLNLSEELDTYQGDDDATPSRVEDLFLITEMLARAEGLASENKEVLAQRINTMSTFIACEGLFRKGLIKLYHNNMSFGEDMGSKTLLEKIDGIDYNSFKS